MDNNNLDTKDYDINSITNYDYRMEAGKKDAIFLHTIGFVTTIIATVFMYMLGTVEPEQMTYFLGYPLWISGATIMYLIMFAIGIIYVWKWEEFPLSAKYKRKGGGK